ncbi:MAG: membrane protein insertase YidC [Deltaproteobacteria bacterium]|nr:membrane protein insertase YidC [Deltaproteobacteria bacterium]
MNDKKQDSNKLLFYLLALLLCMSYLQSTFIPYFSPPKKQQSPELQALLATPSEQVQASTSSLPITAVPKPEQLSINHAPQDEALEKAGEITIKTDKMSATLTLIGGRMRDLYLLEYLEHVDDPDKKLNMVEHETGAPLPLGIYWGQENDALVNYQVVNIENAKELPASKERRVYAAANDRPTKLVLQGKASGGQQIIKKITFNPGGYLIDLSYEISEVSSLEPVEIEWNKRVTAQSPSLLNPYAAGEFVWFDGVKTDRQLFSDFDKEVRKSENQQGANNLIFDVVKDKLTWITMGDVYFMATLIAPEQARGRILRTPDLYRTRLVQSGGKSQNYQLYVGPKILSLLESANYALYRNINIGKTGFISVPMMGFLRLLFNLFGNYGLAIIGFAITAKFCMIPLTMTMFKQGKAMQSVGPEIKRIREQVKDKAKQQQMMMELYKKKGVNPMGGCLPALIQMPIFIGLYSALQLSFELRHAPFALWIKDLSVKESFLIGGVGIPVMVIAFTLTTMLQFWITPMGGDDPEQKKQKQIMMFVMPIMFGFMFASSPAGLTLYFLANNIISIVQQKAFNSGGLKTVIWTSALSSVAILLVGYLLIKIS